MSEQVIPYGKQNITEEDIQAVIEVLKSDYLTQGPMVEKFEQAFADYVGSKYAVAVSNGTAALHLACMALDLKQGQKVLTTPISFVATSNCALYCGANVEFIDIDPNTYLMDLNKVEARLKTAKKNEFAGILPVDFAGLPFPIIELRKLADKFGLWIIEDACHALGGTYKDSSNKEYKCGNGAHSDCTVFSFHPVKHITTGEGGMITTNSEKIYKKLKQLRTHGITKIPEEMENNDGGWFYEMQSLGFNYRIPDILCALGLSQLKRIEQNVIKRNEIASYYKEAISKLSFPIKFQSNPQKSTNAYHLFCIETEKRKDCYDYFKSHNIYTQVHYIPITSQPYYKNMNFQMPNAIKYYNAALSLPMYPELNEEKCKRVIQRLKEFGEKSF